MRILLYCLLSYTFTLCHVAQADSSNVTIDQLRYDLFDANSAARVLGLAAEEEEKNLFINDIVEHETKTYTIVEVGDGSSFKFGMDLLSVRLPVNVSKHWR